ncbi:MAG TPA: hypothetical protein VF481_01015 [Novosphingobium sp.]
MKHEALLPPGEPLASDLTAAEPRPQNRQGDRWTAPKMAAFLRQLSATHSVSAAAQSVGMSRQSAYRLRSRLKGSPFDLAWDVAFQHSYDNLAHAALERALNGVEIPVFHKGEQVGAYRKYDERLTLKLLALSTIHGNVPLLGRRGPEAELHARRFDALVAEVAAGEGGDAPLADPGPAHEGELKKLESFEVSPWSDGDIIEALQGLEGEPDG